MRKFLQGFVYAGRGLAAGLRGERNFKVMLLAAGLVTALGFYRHIGRGQWLAVVLAGGFVLALELVNTGIERLVDILSPQHDPRYGQVKDILAAAVLVASLAAAVVGVLVFLV